MEAAEDGAAVFEEGMEVLDVGIAEGGGVADVVS